MHGYRPNKEDYAIPTSRRTFIAGLGVISARSLANAAMQGGTPITGGQAPPDGLEPGLAYLNTGSLGPCSRDVLARVIEVWRMLESNPVANAYGEGSVGAIANATRAQAAALLGCSADELLLTTGTTSGMNAVAGSVRLAAGEAVLTTDQEHHGATSGWQYRARRDGVRIDQVPVPPGEADADAIVARFAAAVRPETRVISVSHVLFSTGLRMPVAALARLARARNLLFVVDGAQAAGHFPIDVKAIGCHAYATSGHKWLMGPKGTGLLYVSEDAAGRIDPMPWQLGKAYVADSAGIGPLALVAGLGTAIEAAEAIGIAEVERRILALREHLHKALLNVPGITIASPPPGPLATGMLAVRISDSVEMRPLRLRLQEKHRVVVRGIPPEWFNGLRFSTHIFNTAEEINRAVSGLRAEMT